MVAQTRQKSVGNAGYQNDVLYPFAKAFTEAAQNIVATERTDIFSEPGRAFRSDSVKESLREFFTKDYYDPNLTEQYSAEEIEEMYKDLDNQFENDVEGILENSYQSEYMPMLGMSLPIHKLILMNNVFSQGAGIQKVTATQAAFTINLERRILITIDGKEIDMFTNQNDITDAIDAAAPIKTLDMELPADEDKYDILGDVLGGGVGDELSTVTRIVGIYVPNVYIPEGKRLPDADGYYNANVGEIADATTAGTYNVWFHVDASFTPTYGGPNRLERSLNKPVTIRYQKNAAGDIETINDILFGSMNNNKIAIVALKGKITKVRLETKLNTSNANLDMASFKWKIDTDYVEIPEATPVNTTISPEEVKDYAAMYDKNQVTKIISITKDALSEYKDMKLKRQFDASYARLDERFSFYDTFDFAVPEGYALDHLTYRMATFMDFFDDYVTPMLQVLNDRNMTVTIYGDPRIVRRITPTDYTYQTPSSIGPVKLDYTQTIVDAKDNRVYNFIGSDKFRNTNELMVILNPRNTERICYRLYDYQLYISNEIRNAANPALPAIHAFERWKLYEMMPIQGRINILNPRGRVK